MTREFNLARRILDASGALVEPGGTGVLEVVLPEDLASALGWEEEVRLLDHGVEGEGMVIEPGAPALDALVRMARARGRVGSVGLPGNQTLPGKLQREVTDRYPSKGGSVKVISGTSGFGHYLASTFQYVARGPELVQGVVGVVLDVDTLVEPPGLSAAIGAWDLPWADVEPWALPVSTKELLDAASKVAEARVVDELGDHLARSMDWASDVVHRARKFVDGMREEVFTVIARRKLSEQEVQRRQTRFEELEAAMARYEARVVRAAGFDVEANLLGALRLKLPVAKYSCRVTKGKVAREVTVKWNYLTGAWEPRACEACGAPTYDLHVDQETSRLVCAACYEAGQ